MCKPHVRYKREYVHGVVNEKNECDVEILLRYKNTTGKNDKIFTISAVNNVQQ